MPNSTPGQTGRPDDSQCYNCGLVGHWAVACPEPTRATPAGLTAWRNSSNPSPPHLKGQGSSSNKRSKGPIITKYAPPVSQFPPGIGHVPPPPSHHLHPHPHSHLQPLPPALSSYPAQAPSYQQSYSPPPPPPPAAPPPPPYAGTFHPPPPSPYGYPHPQYTTPPLPHATAHYGPPGYIAPPPPGSLPPLHPLPGGQFPPNIVDGQDYRPPQHHHNHGFSRSPPPPLPPPHSSPSARSTPPQRRSEPRSNTGPLKPPTLPPKPPAGIVSHPLPPKPPKSHDQMNSHHDHRNRRKNDRQNKGRDRRQSNDHQQHQRTPNFGPHRDNQFQRSPENRRSNGSSRRGQRQNHGGSNARRQSSEVAVSAEKPTRGSQGRDGGRRYSNEHTAPSTPPAEKMVGKSDEAKSVRNQTDPLAEGSVDGCTNGADIDGKQSERGPEVSSITNVSPGNPKDSDRRSLSDYNGGGSRKRSYDRQHDSTFHQREAKRPRLDDDSFRAGKNRLASEQREECLWNTLDVPREADRRQQTGMDHVATRRRDSADSRASRHSSPSNQSSDLNSLEAELLGRSVKQRSPEKSNTRRCGEHIDARLKPKRRRTNTNSAYSRRW
ncbi:hypothetical protein E4U54_001825 [Claviceps lovelessii]|nr:hypothetical protein E4U54_001825 [Claviceps lovelessii]